MLYDDNFDHAQTAYRNQFPEKDPEKEEVRHREIIAGTEDLIRHHMNLQDCNREEIELQIAQFLTSKL